MGIGKRSRKQVNSVRWKVFERDGGVCVVAHTSFGATCSGEMTIQHRVSRGMGSSARFDEAKYLLTMCAFHNMLDSADAGFRAVCLKYGWSIPRWVPDRHNVNRVPVWYADGWFLLDGLQRFGISDGLARECMLDIYGGGFDA